LPVPILNLSVKLIDRVSASGILGRFSRWQASFAPRRLNYVHMGLFAALFVPLLLTGYVEGPHPGSSIRFWKQAVAEGKPHAARSLVELVQYQATEGSGAAWNELGLLYMEGKLVPKDSSAATTCFIKATELGDPTGCSNVATQFFLKKVPYPLDVVSRAIDILERECAARPNAQASYLVGLAYETGNGRAADPSRATGLLQTACKLGNMDACRRLMHFGTSDG
ncbi:MAG TPA: tetratricopeptide repeat protein, partial [Planctomycetota bacterium]|nr:tetratricopeptide repeat protein [Planctomycetota bacterium]